MKEELAAGASAGTVMGGNRAGWEPLLCWNLSFTSPELNGPVTSTIISVLGELHLIMRFLLYYVWKHAIRSGPWGQWCDIQVRARHSQEFEY
jgi:hypothetical protein